MREVADSTFLLGAAGAAFAVTGIGIAAGSRWAGTAGLICALVVIAASILGIGFVTFMSLGVGIGFSDPLFLQPFALFVVVIGLAISSSAVPFETETGSAGHLGPAAQNATLGTRRTNGT